MKFYLVLAFFIPLISSIHVCTFFISSKCYIFLHTKVGVLQLRQTISVTYNLVEYMIQNTEAALICSELYFGTQKFGYSLGTTKESLL
jgi:hypothetical protein